MEIIKFVAAVFWLYLLVNGQKQRITMVPTYNSLGDVHKYICNFYENKECIWQLNNVTIAITNINYRYFEENNHCSIIANDNKTLPLNDIECVIYADPSPTIINISDWDKYTSLHCFTSTPISCSWLRNGEPVNIVGRYRYFRPNDERDCSIAINKMTSIDIGNWQCVSKSSPDQNSQTLANYTLTTSETPVKKTSKKSKKHQLGTTIGDSEMPADYLASPTQFTTSDANNRVFSGGKTAQNELIIGLSIMCLIIILLASTTFYLFKRQKKLKNAMGTLQVYANEPTEIAGGNHTMQNLDEEKIYENIPQIIRTANETQTQPEMHPPPRNIFNSNPSNVLESNDKSTEVIYTQVIVTRRMSYFGPPEVPHCDVDQVTYATITHQKINQDSVKP